MEERPSSDRQPRGARRSGLASDQWARSGLSLLTIALAVAVRLPELGRYATIDESRWVSRGADFLTYMASRDFDRTYLVGHPGVTAMWLGGLGLGREQARAFSYAEGGTDVTRRPDYLQALIAARTAALLANATMLGLIVWLACKVLGPGPAGVGALLLLFDPFLGAHSRLIHLDGLLASFMTVAGLAGLAFWRGGGWIYLILAALGSGLAMLTKAPSVFLLAWLPAVAVLQLARNGAWRKRGTWVRFIVGQVAWLAGAAVVCLMLWPALRLKPMAVAREVVDFAVRNGSGERDNFFLGAPVEDPGPLFYPVGLLFRATPLLLAGLIVLLIQFRRRKSLAKHGEALLAASFAFGFLLMMSLAQKKFDRYALPAVPTLDLLAGLGLWLASRRWLAVRGRWRLAAVIAIALTAVWPLASVYPYYLAYYNPLLGGGSVAQRLVFVGWGEGLDQVAEYLNDKPLVLQAPLVATSYHRALQAHLRDNGAMPIERAELADYIVPYVNGIQRDPNNAALAALLAGQEPELRVWIQGIEYARVYRGPHLAIEKPFEADFAGRVRLESIVIAPGSGRARPGDDLLLRLRFRALAGDGRPLASLRILDAAGRAVARDELPLAGGILEGDQLLVDAQMHLPERSIPGDYRLVLSMQDPPTGRPLGAMGGDSVVLQSLGVLPPAAR